MRFLNEHLSSSYTTPPRPPTPAPSHFALPELPPSPLPPISPPPIPASTSQSPFNLLRHFLLLHHLIFLLLFLPFLFHLLSLLLLLLFILFLPSSPSPSILSPPSPTRFPPWPPLPPSISSDPRSLKTHFLTDKQIYPLKSFQRGFQA